MAGKLDPVDAAMAKMLTTELHCKAADECLQLFGGWGYMWEMPIARAYADARITKIAGGSIEIMKLIIARQMAGRGKAPKLTRTGPGARGRERAGGRSRERDPVDRPIQPPSGPCPRSRPAAPPSFAVSY